MKRIKGVAALLSLTLAVGPLAACSSSSAEPFGSEPEQNVQETVGPFRAQDDFFGYVNQQTLDELEYHYGSSIASAGISNYSPEDQIAEIVRDVVAGSGYTVGSEEYVIQNMYNSFMVYDFDNAGIPDMLQSAFDDIKNAGSVDELLAVEGRLVRDYASEFTFVNVNPDVNYLRANEYCMTFGCVGKILNVDFKKLEDDFSDLNECQTYVSSVLRAMGYDRETAEDLGRSAALLIMDIYNASDHAIPDAVMKEEYFRLYTRDQIEEILSNVDLGTYFEAMGLDESALEEFGLFDPGQLEAINGILVEENLEVLKAIELSSMVSEYSQFVYPSCSELAGYMSVDYDEPEEQAVAMISEVFTKVTDPLYVERYFNEETDEVLRSMCDDIRESYRGLISQAEWLSEETRASLLEKLDNIIYVTGSDLHRADPATYAGIEYDNFFNAFVQYMNISYNSHIRKLYEPVDRTEPLMNMQVENACYVPSMNIILITVAILHDPLFNYGGDYYQNLGGLGSVIAHEMGHAFDSNCINYDQYGVYNPTWVSDTDRETLQQRNEAAIDYFEDRFTIFGVYHVNGQETLGENFADLGGLECISRIPQTDEQRRTMYESYARVWCMKTLDSYLITQLATDPHSPAVIRVNAMLSSIDQFYETYGVAEGDEMYIPPEQRISRWY